jgi:hypothetical protein
MVKDVFTDCAFPFTLLSQLILASRGLPKVPVRSPAGDVAHTTVLSCSRAT